jgi:hypothetical protein
MAFAAARASAAQQPYAEVDCLSLCSTMISMTSEDPRALELADQAIEMARPLGNDYLLSLALAQAGIAKYRTDRPPPSRCSTRA